MDFILKMMDFMLKMMDFTVDPSFLHSELSLRSRIIVWEILGTCYWGPILMYYFWNFVSIEHTCNHLPHTLWLH